MRHNGKQFSNMNPSFGAAQIRNFILDKRRHHPTIIRVPLHNTDLTGKGRFMQVTVKELEQSILIEVEGDIEMTTMKPFKEKAFEVGSNFDKDVEIDLSKVDYLDSSGMGVLLTLSKMLRKKNKSMKIINYSEKIKKILHLSSLKEIL